jgi:hypothetical protein
LGLEIVSDSNGTFGCTCSVQNVLKLKRTDKRMAHRVSSPPNLITFALNHGTASSPAIRIYTPETLAADLKTSTMYYCKQHVRVFAHSNQKKVWALHYELHIVSR